MTASKRHSRDRLKELTALLADHAEDTMDADDVDQVRAEIIALYDRLVEQLEALERLRRAVENAAVNGEHPSIRAWCDLALAAAGIEVSTPASTRVAAPDLAAPGNAKPDRRPGEGAAHILRTPDPMKCPDCGSIHVLNAGTRTHQCADCGCLFFPSNQELKQEGS